MDTVEDVVRTREFEPSRFDYKEVLVPERGDEKRREEHRLSIRRTACAMANAQGGLILFGIADRKVNVTSQEDRILGIPLDRDLAKEFGDQMQHIQPELHFQASPAPIRLRHDETRGVFVVRIEESALRPHMVLPDHVFYRRADGGQNRKMGHDEVRSQMLLSDEVRRRMVLFRFKISQFRVLSRRMLEPGYRLDISFDRFDTNTFDLLLADICGFITEATLWELIELSEIAGRVNATLSHSVLPSGGFSYAGLHDDKPVRLDLESVYRRCVDGETVMQNLLGSLTQQRPQ
jgi:hypothetical protein